jgi:[calcium/calmodulin-dependent protein kinase] kinase
VHKCASIIHRDIKPPNILIDENDDVKLADFGVSEIVDKSGMTKRRAGTNCFLPPEVFLQKTVEGKKVDIWSMGVTLYKLVQGELPFKDPSFGSHSFQKE